MNVYEIVTEETGEDKKIIETVQYWEAPDFETAALHAVRECEELDYDLRSVRYVLTITQFLEQELIGD